MSAISLCRGPAPISTGARALYVLTALSLLVSAPPAPAQEEEPWYTVEVIVFERPGDTGLYAEAWPVEPGLPDLSDAVALDADDPLGEADRPIADGPERQQGESATTPLIESPEPEIPPPATPRPFQRLPAEEHELIEAWEALEKSNEYRPLLHVAWRQPGFAEADAKLTHLRNDNGALGRARNGTGEEAESPTMTPEAYVIPTFSAQAMIARDPTRAALDGTVKLHRARYLHVKADLLYYRPPRDGAGVDDEETLSVDSTDAALVEQLLAEDARVPSVFRLTESRRMRSGELHYLDHPLFGVLIKVRPYELPEESILPLEPAEGTGEKALEAKSVEGG